MYSVVIPAYNEEKFIGSCLEALTKQDTHEKFEVILVDNNSSDQTVEIARKFKDRLDLKIIKQEIKGRGPARAKGFEHASGEIIFSLDADTIAPPQWISHLSSKLKQSNGVAVAGTCRIKDCPRHINLLFNFSQPLMMRAYRLFVGHYWLNGFNSAIYKEAYKKSGGFDVDLNAQEDVELSFRVSKIGKIIFLPQIAVIFSGRRFRNGFFRGLVPYLMTYAGYFSSKKKIILSDER